MALGWTILALWLVINAAFLVIVTDRIGVCPASRRVGGGLAACFLAAAVCCFVAGRLA
ncbi:hypothetical protein [Methylobacterium sp. JK268]